MLNAAKFKARLDGSKKIAYSKNWQNLKSTTRLKRIFFQTAATAHLNINVRKMNWCNSECFEAGSEMMLNLLFDDKEWIFQSHFNSFSNDAKPRKMITWRFFFCWKRTSQFFFELGSAFSPKSKSSETKTKRSMFNQCPCCYSVIGFLCRKSIIQHKRRGLLSFLLPSPSSSSFQCCSKQ